MTYGIYRRAGNRYTLVAAFPGALAACRALRRYLRRHDGAGLEAAGVGGGTYYPFPVSRRGSDLRPGLRADDAPEGRP